jgi:pyruvate/2-oxoglutarate dehydrogenase complex dihydrolipoamide acyltransferase (E2) component
MSDSDTDTEEDGAGADALSPSVRRLVRQYELDVTAIHGSGPHGRIRVADVMALIGGRTHAPELEPEPRARAFPLEQPPRAEALGAAAVDPAALERGVPVTMIFECDLGRVLANQKLLREQGQDVVLTSYFAVACSGALSLLHGVRPEDSPADLGLSVAAADGTTASTLLREARDQPFATINAELAALLGHSETATRNEPLDDIAIVLYHHGLSGSLIALPTPLAAGQRASLGIGAVRRVVAVKNVNGEESARIAAHCYLSVSFFPDTIELSQANLFLNEWLRTLERWPVKPAGTM